MEQETMNSELRKDCPMRHENGNCLPCGGFCTSNPDPICEAMQNAYEMGRSKTNDAYVRQLLHLDEDIEAGISTITRKQIDEFKEDIAFKTQIQPTPIVSGDAAKRIEELMKTEYDDEDIRRGKEKLETMFLQHSPEEAGHAMKELSDKLASKKQYWLGKPVFLTNTLILFTNGVATGVYEDFMVENDKRIAQAEQEGYTRGYSKEEIEENSELAQNAIPNLDEEEIRYHIGLGEFTL